jgi:hypothetical protein
MAATAVAGTTLDTPRVATATAVGSVRQTSCGLDRVDTCLVPRHRNSRAAGPIHTITYASAFGTTHQSNFLCLKLANMSVAQPKRPPVPSACWVDRSL